MRWLAVAMAAGLVAMVGLVAAADAGGPWPRACAPRGGELLRSNAVARVHRREEDVELVGCRRGRGDTTAGTDFNSSGSLCQSYSALDGKSVAGWGTVPDTPSASRARGAGGTAPTPTPRRSGPTCA